MTAFTNRLLPLAIVGALAASSVAALAQTAPTLGEQLSSGQLSEPAFTNLISGAGLPADEARALTLSEIVRIKWATQDE